MNLQDLAVLFLLVPYTMAFPHLGKFPEYRSLAGLSSQEILAVSQTFTSTPGAQPLPPPIDDTSAKLVFDAAHPFILEQPGDIRGPCPGLSTLASHGYLPHNGIVTPAEIITASQEGFNMGRDLAAFITYAAFVVDGNHLTNLMSIGENTTVDGDFTPGINIHGNLEGDASATRGDAYFGDNFNFNETLFNQFEYAANLVGDGIINVEAASLQKSIRINDSIARNPTFSLDTPRFLTAYAETTFLLAFFTSNQTADTTDSVTLDDARSFFEQNKFPDGFYRRQAVYNYDELLTMIDKILHHVGVFPGHSEGLGNYVVNLNDPGTLCYGYHKQVNLTAQLYPDPTPDLEAAIKTNLVTFYESLADPSCEQLFPYGK